MSYRIEYYPDNATVRPFRVERAPTEREARRCAARMLGRANLRGAQQWHHHRDGEDGFGFGFGPQTESNDGEYVHIMRLAAAEGGTP